MPEAPLKMFPVEEGHKLAGPVTEQVGGGFTVIGLADAVTGEQPYPSVIVSVYTPLLATVTFGIMGLAMFEVKPSGPVHENVNGAFPPVRFANKFSVCPIQKALALLVGAILAGRGARVAKEISSSPKSFPEAAV